MRATDWLPLAFDRDQALDRFARIEANRFREIQKLDHINAPLPTFDCRDEGLITVQSCCDFGLCEASLLSLFDEKCS